MVYFCRRVECLATLDKQENKRTDKLTWLGDQLSVNFSIHKPFKKKILHANSYFINSKNSFLYFHFSRKKSSGTIFSKNSIKMEIQSFKYLMVYFCHKVESLLTLDKQENKMTDKLAWLGDSHSLVRIGFTARTTQH